MLYTVMPTAQGDRILLYASEQAARASADAGRPICSVAVRFEARHRQIIPLGGRPEGIDPTWAAPAEQHADGSITAKGPIPEVFFAACPPGPSARDTSAR
jgi:hypothetical protein